MGLGGMDTQAILDESYRIWNAAPPAILSDRAVFPGAGADIGAASGLDTGSGSDSAGAGLREDMLLLGDNLEIMAALSAQIGAGTRAPINLVYMDPPYFTNRDYSATIRTRTKDGDILVKAPAFSDKWNAETACGGGADPMACYLKMLVPRIIAARELLADDGCFWLHLDRRAVHYVKVMTDAVFGGADFLVNEVVWTYKSGGSSTKRFANKHDTLLFYAKNKRKYKFFPQEEKSYNRALKPYRFKGVKEFRDDTGWYTIVNMKDVWEIPMVGRTAGERTGYATQKPEALMARIVLACTEAGDVCLDPFAGSGTLAAACGKLNRHWISIDENPL
ncbi:MAG: site-specific DNA-methyltransferase, partial [Clostridiales Family XIII bacterium]|nr:site-specific DNA-methyltransferase [Clostridiales Family XIII bacterium]